MLREQRLPGQDPQQREHYRYDALQHLSSSQRQDAEHLHRYQADQLGEAGPWRYRYDDCGRVIERSEHRTGFRPQT
ncbi:hypothetical protein [Chitinilyticum litopenaei]|uniref:hypothetical protein n=1 Tax=Chitinilyticum litopenaei TaxID=1121276 RepID=UPI00042839CD|nr:hypothetical protein [Chitinilyticum litopenaei]